MKVGDVVICSCETNVWYKSTPGVVVDIDWLNNVRVLYGNGRVLELTASSLHVIK